MSTPPQKQRWGRWVRVAFGVAGVGFIVLAAREMAQGFDPSSLTVDPLFVVLSLLPALLSTWVQSSAWLCLLETWTGHEVPRVHARALYFAAQVARYTPGKVGLPAVRLAGASSIGVSPQVMGSTLLLEVLTWCTTGGSICALVLGLYPEVLGALGERLAGLSWFAVAVGIVALFVFVFVDRRVLPRRLHQLLRLSGQGPLIPLAAVGFYCVHWSGWILHGTLLGMAFGATAQNAVLVGVALVLGILAGFLAFLAPAGAGVREAVVATTATRALGVGGALTAGIVARGISLGIDLVLWALMARWAARSKRARLELG